MGSIVIGGMAALLICTFLGPKFIDLLRDREFGQQIREEGPAAHHGKAGTPTMGGLIIFLAGTVTFLILDAPHDTHDAVPALAGLGTGPGAARTRLVGELTKGVQKRPPRVLART